MSYCSNCGTKLLEEGAYCHFCGASLQNSQKDPISDGVVQAQEPDLIPVSQLQGFTGDFPGSTGNSLLASPVAGPVMLREEPASITEAFRQPQSKSGLRPGHIAAIAAAGVLVLVLGVFLLLCYLPSAKSYKEGTEKLEAGAWQEAKTLMESAEKKGIFIFQNSMDIYKQKVDEYGKKQLEQLESLLQSGEYNKLEETLQSIPEDSTYMKDARTLVNETNSKIEEELAQIDQMIQDQQLDEALNQVKLFMAAYQYDKYTVQAEQKLELVNQGLEAKRQEEEQAAEAAAQEAYAREQAAAEAQKSDGQAIEILISGYVNAWAQAINDKDFTIIEPYITPMSSFYQEQQRVHQSLSEKGIREELLEYQVIGFEPQAELGTYKVYVYEKYTVYAQDGSQKDSENNWAYTVQSNPQWGISKIERDGTHQGKS